MIWQTTRFDLDLSRPRVMGIVNLTPDSFSDGGQHADSASALRHAERLLREGADILDIGGESTRPGAAAVPADVEWQRIEGVLRQALQWQVPLSVDTYQPETMRRALDMGGGHHQRRLGLAAAGRAAAVAAHPRCGLCLMHMHRDPQSMQALPMQGDALPLVLEFLANRAACCERRAWLPSASCSTTASVLAKPWRKTSACWLSSSRCWRWAIPCWRVGHANRHWGLYWRVMGWCRPLSNASPPASALRAGGAQRCPGGAGARCA